MPTLGAVLPADQDAAGLELVAVGAGWADLLHAVRVGMESDSHCAESLTGLLKIDHWPGAAKMRFA